MIDSVKGGVALGLLILLAACSPRGANGVGSGPPGIDVADAALRGGSPELALQMSSSLVAKFPGNEAALLTQGEALTALGRTAEAEASFQKALVTNPSSVGGHIGLGRLRLATDPVAAEGLFLDAVQREPRNAVAWNDLGIARDLQGRHSEAQDAYRQALGVQPDMTAAQVNLALSLAMSGRSGDAVGLIRPLASGPNATPKMRHDLAAVLAMGGDKPAAASILSQDLSPSEVQQALNDFTAANPGSTASLLKPETTATPTIAPGPQATLLVQLAGPTPSRDTAETKWERLKKEMPELLGDREPTLAQVAHEGESVWRVRTGGFTDTKQAAAFCERVRATGTSCVLVQ